MTMAAPVPEELAPNPITTADTVHDLMTRRREFVKNRIRYHLTETDCILLCTHGVDRYYQHGQIIAEEGHPVQNLYRIKSGRICLQKQGQNLYNLTQGFFIGEGLFIYHEDEYEDYFGATLVANGPVTLTELNISFIRQLLEADKVLSFKIYRHIAGKLSALLLSVLGTTSVGEDISSPKSDHSSPSSVHSASQVSLSASTSSIGSLQSERSSNSLQREESTGSIVPEIQVPPNSVIMTEEMAKEATTRVRGKKLRKRLVSKIKEKTPFKVYHLDSSHLIPVTCQLTPHKIIIATGAGIKAKRKIKYNKILDITKIGNTTATLIYGVQARTLYFKTEEELNEFCGIVRSLISTENKEIFSTQIAPNITSPPPFAESSPFLSSPAPTEDQALRDKVVMHQLTTQQVLKRGELVVAEGDLYQRIYTVVSGELHFKRKGVHLVTLKDGDLFGVLTLFHMRPSLLDVEVASETATLLIIPAYRINELISSNFPLAVRLHKKAAQLIYGQVGNILKAREEVVDKFSDYNFIG